MSAAAFLSDSTLIFLRWTRHGESLSFNEEYQKKGYALKERKKLVMIQEK
jgi:hypothetical protein